MNAVEFLASTPPEISWKIDAYNEAKHEQATRDWYLGALIATGVNDPKNYPKAPVAAPTTEPGPAPMTDEEARRDLMSLRP